MGGSAVHHYRAPGEWSAPAADSLCASAPLAGPCCARAPFLTH